MNNLKVLRGLPYLTMIVMLLTMACGGGGGESSMEEEMQSLNEILQVGRQRAVNKENIDWDALTVQVNDTYANTGFEAAVRVFLAAMGDNQSFYGRLSGANIFSSEANCNSSGFGFGGLSTDIGFIQMRTFVGSLAEATFFAGDRHNRARTQDNADIRGWVVDLSTTNGGDLYAQIASLGMFFDRETLGYFINADEEVPWGFANGNAFLRRVGEARTVVTDPYTLMDPNGKLVVVIDLPTAGAGEAALIALKDRPNTLVLGRPTCGLASVTESFSLSNSDFLVLATHYIADSDKETYTDRLQPDESIGNSTDLVERIESFMNE